MIEKDIIKTYIAKYYDVEPPQIQENSGLKFVFTEGKTYDLDKIIFYNRRNNAESPIAIYVLDSSKNEQYLIYCAIDYLITQYSPEDNDVRRIPNVITKIQLYIENNLDTLMANMPEETMNYEGLIYLNKKEDKKTFNPMHNLLDRPEHEHRHGPLIVTENSQTGNVIFVDEESENDDHYLDHLENKIAEYQRLINGVINEMSEYLDNNDGVAKDVIYVDEFDTDESDDDMEFPWNGVIE
jgi:hypothetical protein